MRRAPSSGARASLVRRARFRAHCQTLALHRDLNFLRRNQLLGAAVLHHILIRQLVSDLIEPIREPRQSQHLIASSTRLCRSIADYDIPFAHLIGRRVRGLAEREDVEGRSACVKRIEHLLMGAIAELGAFRRDRDDVRPLGLALLQSMITLGLFAIAPGALSGSLLQQISHGISTGALFLIVGLAFERRQTREIAAFGGLSSVMPVFAVLFLVMTLSSIGLPGLNGFVGERLILQGVFVTHRWWAAAAASGMLTAVTVLHEPLGLRKILGAAAVLAGVGLTRLSSSKSVVPPQE